MTAVFVLFDNFIVYTSRTSILILAIFWSHCQCDFTFDSYGFINQTVKAVLGDAALLRCNTTAPSHDNITIVMWYHEKRVSPFLSVDKRNNGTHYYTAPDWKSTASFQLNENGDFSILTLKPVKRSHQGLYRCRVDFKKSPTKDCIVNVSLIVPPERLDIFDDKGAEVRNNHIGPYKENATLMVTCSASGGWPPPRVTWWQGNALLDDFSERLPNGSVSNTLTLKKLSRSDLYTTYTCQASNNNLDSLSKSVSINMTLTPQTVELMGADKAMSAGRTHEISCQVYGANPSPVIKWSKGSEKLKILEKSDSNDGNLTIISRISFVPHQQDDGKVLSCHVDSLAASGPGQFSDSRKLNIIYKPVPIIVLGKNLNGSAITEGVDVYFDCQIKSNIPVSKITWKQDGKFLRGNHSAGIVITEETLVLQKVSRRQSGLYSCVATNAEGEGESTSTYLDVKFAPVCYPTFEKKYGADRGEKVRVKCEVEANPPIVSFSWEFNSTSSRLTLPAERFTSNGTRSYIHFQPNSENDYGMLHCRARNAVGDQVESCAYLIYPAGKPDPLVNCTVTNRTYSSFTISCVAGFDGGSPQRFVAEVYESGGVMREMKQNLSKDSPEFFVDDLRNELTYDIVLYAFNSKGRSSTTEFSETLTLAHKHAPNKIVLPVDLSALLTILVILLCVLIVLCCCIMIMVRSQNSRRRKKHYCYKSKESLEKNPDIIPNKDDVSCSIEITNMGEEKLFPSKQTDISLILQNSYGTDMNSDFILHQHQEDYKTKMYRKRTSSLKRLNESEITYASCDQPCPPFVTQETPLLSGSKVPFVTEGQHAVQCCIHGLSRSTSIS